MEEGGVEDWKGLEKIGKDWEKNKHFNESSTHTQLDQRHRHSIEKVDTHTMLLQITNNDSIL